ncbi:hypothetical protein OZY43_07560 [Lactobacillus sp. ESL0785]|uniref:hypothetical protein n=1 Tax=Lactobacillus sp. ESL0785 TaxID=2983232 RepID=UPI0023F94429|nr:hypothetical protein [Lactobacillus sp. ESL0785]WEV70784.1 hypothetical protein OZY43_07560 [Lactobacillus sp. ESL0785]
MSKLNNFVIKFLDKAHLNTKKILLTYLYALLLIPLFFSFFMILEAAITKNSIVLIMAKSPLVAVDVIIALTDFILGYYLWLKKNEILRNYVNYRFFMTCQALGQLLVGNLFCAVLALLGLISLQLAGKDRPQKGAWPIIVVSVIFMLIFSACLAMIILLKVKNSGY